MVLYIFYFPLQHISSTCFESDLTLWKRTVRVSCEIIFLFIVVKTWFCFRCSNSGNAFLYIPLYNKNCRKFLPYHTFIQALLSTAVFPPKIQFLYYFLSSVALWCGPMVDTEKNIWNLGLWIVGKCIFFWIFVGNLEFYGEFWR